MKTRISFAAAAATAGAVAVAASAFAAAPPSSRVPPPGVTVQKDLPYLAPDRKEKLDLYLPADRPAGTRSPGVVLIHGGGWSSGTKSANREWEEGTTLAKAGYVCVSIDYRLDKHERWPTNVWDCKNAVRFLRVHAAEYGVDPDHIGVLGGSAGGHLSLMVGLTSDVPELEPQGDDNPYPGVSDRVQAAVDLYGITDFRTPKHIAPDGTPTTPAPGHWNSVFGDHAPITDADLTLASPVDHLKPDSPPILILHGLSDTTVDRDQSKELDAKLTEAKIPHQIVFVPGGRHTFDLERQGNGQPLSMDLRPIVLAFFERYLKAGAAR